MPQSQNPARQAGIINLIFGFKNMATGAIAGLYRSLLEQHGPQGWWPVIRETGKGLDFFYHRGDHAYPRTEEQRFEICAGAILAQGVSWKGAEKALASLYSSDALLPEELSGMDSHRLGSLIKSSGYFNQKAEKLKVFSRFYLSLAGGLPSRQELLSLRGIGPETADSMLLYAYGVPTFVVDSYTKRMLSSLGHVKENAGYGEMKSLFESSLPQDAWLFSEYHALIVEHSKKSAAKLTHKVRPCP